MIVVEMVLNRFCDLQSIFHANTKAYSLAFGNILALMLLGI